MPGADACFGCLAGDSERVFALLPLPATRIAYFLVGQGAAIGLRWRAPVFDGMFTPACCSVHSAEL